MTSPTDAIRDSLKQALHALNLPESNFVIEVPPDPSLGDYSANVALILAREVGKPPHDLARLLASELEKNLPPMISRVEVAGAGFINFHLTKEFLGAGLIGVTNQDSYGKGDLAKGGKIIIEYTDPNPFKEFHIGHLMSNTIGEALSRLVAFQGAEVKRACYQGDVGLHVAKAIWGKRGLDDGDDSAEAWGKAYALGATAYEKDTSVKEEIGELNKKIYDKSDPAVNKIYEEGRKISLDYFEQIYKRLGTKFDLYFFESESWPIGKKLVEENIGKVFELSEGAVVFRAEEVNPKLHTRVFLTKESLPTYEAKELGLAKLKKERSPADTSIVVTGNEVDQYFAVVLAALKLIDPVEAAKTKHLSHGMLRLPEGKMSSRSGNVVTAESLLDALRLAANAKITDENLPAEERKVVVEAVALAAIKYSILKQAPGRDTVFNLEQAISFEGDSGPYLQYTLVRARSILTKAPTSLPANDDLLINLIDVEWEITRQLLHFPEVTARAARDFAPQHLVEYLTKLAGDFNTYYAKQKIIDSGPGTASRLALTRAVAQVLTSGLDLLAIPTLERM